MSAEENRGGEARGQGLLSGGREPPAEVTSDQSLREEGERDLWGSIPGRRNIEAESPGIGVHLAFPKDLEEVGGAGEVSHASPGESDGDQVTENLVDHFKNLVFHLKKKNPLWDFPGGPVVGTLCFHCRGRGFNP